MVEDNKIVDEKELENALSVIIKDCLDNDSQGFNKVVKKLINNKKNIFEIDFKFNQYEFDEEEKDFINVLENLQDE